MGGGTEATRGTAEGVETARGAGGTEAIRGAAEGTGVACGAAEGT
jgi:hypothetical protein